MEGTQCLHRFLRRSDVAVDISLWLQGADWRSRDYRWPILHRSNSRYNGRSRRGLRSCDIGGDPEATTDATLKLVDAENAPLRLGGHEGMQLHQISQFFA